VVGVVLAAVSKGSYDDGKALAARGPLELEDHRRLAGLRSDLKGQSLGADIGFAGALVGATVGTVLWLSADGDDDGASRGAAW
jgi:hypothetical protein